MQLKLIKNKLTYIKNTKTTKLLKLLPNIKVESTKIKTNIKNIIASQIITNTNKKLCLEKSNLDILLNISICTPRKQINKKQNTQKNGLELNESK